MSKLLVLIASGPNDPAKVKAGLGFARVAKDSDQVDDVQCCFLADGVEVLVPDRLPAFQSLLNALIERGIFIMACQLHAEQKGWRIKSDKLLISTCTTSEKIWSRR